MDEEYSNQSFRYVCSVPFEYQKISGIANHVDTFLTLILPFIVITFLNCRITMCVWKLKGQREGIVAVAKLNRSNSLNSSDPKPQILISGDPNVKVINNALNDSTCCLLRNGISMGTNPEHCGGSGSCTTKESSVPTTLSTGVPPYRPTYNHSSAAEVRVTKTLLLVSTVFLVLNLPSHAVRAFTFICVSNTLFIL